MKRPRLADLAGEVMGQLARALRGQARATRRQQQLAQYRTLLGRGPQYKAERRQLRRRLCGYRSARYA